MKTNTKQLFISLIALLAVYVCPAQSTIQNPFSRSHLSLNGQWNYIIDPYENGFYNYRRKAFDESESGKGGYYDNRQQDNPNDLIEYNFQYAEKMDIPGDWNSQDKRLEFYEGTVWFYREFEFSPEQGRSYLLYFGAVNYEAHVYLNGKKLGMHKGGFTPFEFEVNDGLVNGKNFIVVKVDNSRHQDEVPTVNTDWWNYGGITRDVLLLDVPANHIRDYKIQLSPDNNKEIKGFVALAGDKIPKKVSIEIPELQIKQELKVTGDGKIDFAFSSDAISYWSPEKPKQYTVTIKAGNDQLTDQIGFRTIDTQGKKILLNGQQVFLKGISIHDENPLVAGRLRSEGDMRMMLQWAKELGCNFVRLAHYPHNEKMLRLAEEMGLMVWAEVPVYWTISWENAETFANAQTQLTDLIQRDKNRAAVVVWSVGNETPVGEPRMKFMGGLVDLVRQQDDSRLVAAALEVNHSGDKITCDDPLADRIDLLSFNEYTGWYGGPAPEKLPEIEFEFTQDKPVFISEFGAGAQPGFYSKDRVRWSEEFQEDIYINQLKMLEKIDGLSGMTPWILVDFKSPRRPHPIYQQFWNRKGLISDTGKKKKAFFVLRDYYQTK